MTPDRSFWKELRERHVIRVGIVYLTVAWAMIEGAGGRNPGGDLERSDFLRAVATVHEELGDP